MQGLTLMDTQQRTEEVHIFQVMTVKMEGDCQSSLDLWRQSLCTDFETSGKTD
uniref:Uncharacterized protein n=1 Tax=Arion vulgaris TaxID=1028688 RepID=A0A0B7AI84_9EUPU